MKSFLVAFIVLLVVHTAVSFISYRFSTTTSTVSDSVSGEIASVRSTTPAPVILYIIFGYAGLIISALLGIVDWLRRPM